MKNVILTSALTTLIASPAMADNHFDPDPFIGGSVIYSKMENLDIAGADIDDTGDLGEFKDDRSSWKVFAGAWINDWVGIEGQYIDLGEYKDSGFKLDADAKTATLMVGLPVGDHTRIYAKGGRMWWDADLKAPLDTSASREGSNPFYGAGVTIALMPNLNLRAEYERAQFDGDNVKADIDFASAGLGFMF